MTGDFAFAHHSQPLRSSSSALPSLGAVGGAEPFAGLPEDALHPLPPPREGEGRLAYLSALARFQAGRVAVSATEARHFVAATQAGGVVFSTDGGLTWSFSEGAPPASDPGPGGVFNYRQILCSDRVTGDFHLYARKTGQLYRSRDGGRSFSAAAKLCASSGSVIYLRATPDHAGHLWLADGKSLHRSIDGGETWRRIDSDERRATSDAQRAGNVPQALTADRAVFGRVFIGTNGSGVWYGEAAPTRDNPADSVR